MPPSGYNSYDTKYQKVARLWMPACNDMNGCDVCPANGLDDNLCRNMYDVICSQSPEWWEKQFEHLKVVERKPQKGKTPAKLKRPVVEEILITCPNCRVQEVITLNDWILESTVKFEQVASSFTVLHHCGKGIYCEVTLPDRKTTVADYIRERKK